MDKKQKDEQKKAIANTILQKLLCKIKLTIYKNNGTSKKTKIHVKIWELKN